MFKKNYLTKKNIIQAKFTDITNDYIFEGKPIGSGGYGQVYKAIDKKTGFIRAIKLIKTTINLKTNSDGKTFTKLTFKNPCWKISAEKLKCSSKLTIIKL